MPMHGASFDQQSADSLRALENVVKLCLRDAPCGVEGCRKCRRYVEEAWQHEMERADKEAQLEALIWGRL